MPFGRRRPLLRAAAVGGGAYVAGKRAQQSRDEQTADADQAGYSDATPPATAPAASPQTGLSQQAIDQLKQLGELKDQGVLTDEEFTAQKQRLLQGM